MIQSIRLFAAILTALFFLMEIAITVKAGPLEDASAAFKRGDYTTVLTLLRPLANDNVSEAQYELGFMYYNGFGVPQDYTLAGSWYRLAAD